MMFVASQIDNDHPMDGGDAVETQSNGVLCSICLESVFGVENRSSAKLQCGHEFHLDCIGSAFNTKGEMQCPNCRKVEKGRWLFANGSTRVPEWLYASGSTRMTTPEYNGDERQHDWNSEEETYDIAFPELPFRVHWCPYGGLPRFRSSFEEGESPSVTYHDLQGDHAIFSEHTGGTSVTHSYITYLGNSPPASINSSDTVEIDGPDNNHNWNGFSVTNNVMSLHDLSPLDLHYPRSRRSPQTSSHVNGADQAATASASSRSTRGESDSWSGTFGQPYIIAQGTGGPRGAAGSFVAHHYSSSGARRHERTQRPHATHHHHHQQQQQQQHQQRSSNTSPGMASRRHNNGSRGMNPVVQASPHSDHSSGFFVYPPPTSSSGHRNNVHEAENRYPIHTHPLERDYISHFPASSFDRDSSGWGSHNQASGGSDSDNRTGNIWQRHWS